MKQQQPKEPQVRNVIFVVGDGMGVAQVYASVVAQRADNSVFLRFPYSGFSRTYSHNRYTTDSGAGGSALMTGHKVENYHIALGPDGTAYPSILSYAKQHYGKAAGFVVTSSVLDATPASTYAHVTDRNLQARGYAMAYNTLDLMALKGRRICGLLSPDNPPKAMERGRMLTLGTLKAIETLNVSDNGFVLMVEGSQIDWACHNNDSAYLMDELADFEDMLSAVLDFAKHDGHTLVVVTADHETGGLTLLNGNIATGQSKPSWATGSHSGIMVPVFAFGPGAENFTGIMQNSDFFNKIIRILEK